MPVVSDASPLILFAKIEKLDLLKELYLELVIPSQVRNEVVKHDDAETSPEINRIGEKLGLHRGEMSALSVAMHLDIKEILADDKLARIAARILGLRAIGCPGIVMKAFKTGLITRSDAVDLIQKLVKAGLWISPEVLAEVFISMEE